MRVNALVVGASVSRWTARVVVVIDSRFILPMLLFDYTVVGLKSNLIYKATILFSKRLTEMLT